MFCLKIAEMSQFAYMKAMFILSYYKVNVRAYSNGEDTNSTYLVVDGPVGVHRNGEVEDYVRMAEMAFQMDFQQVGMKCPHCDDDKITCGHLTFGTMIDSSAFDKAFG